MDRFLTNLRRQAEEAPLLVLAALAAVMTAFTRLVNASVDAKNSRAWAKEVARRVAKDAAKR